MTPASAPAATAANSSEAAPIPFRRSEPVSGSEVAGVLIITLVVLALLAVAAEFARRRGWLTRWMSGRRNVPSAARSLGVSEVLRVSRRTSVYRIECGGQAFLLAESDGGCHWLGHPLPSEAK